MILEVSWDGLWMLSFGLAQFQGHGSWLICEVALRMMFLAWYIGPNDFEIKNNAKYTYPSGIKKKHESLIKDTQMVQKEHKQYQSNNGVYRGECQLGILVMSSR